MKYSGKEEKGILYFQLSGVDKSFANAIRRTLIGNIPIQVMKPEDCVIHVNTSRFTNEMIKSRLSCIPIHETNINKQLTIECTKKNDTSQLIYVTTEEFKSDLFPPTQINKTESRYIDWIRLRPDEEISFTCKTSVGTANQCGAYNSVATCSYGFTKDEQASERAWGEKERTITKEDWDFLDGKRYVIPNSFDFILETVGVFTNQQLLTLSSTILILQLEQCVKSITIVPSLTTMEYCFDVSITGDYTIGTINIPMQGDYTIGKILEYELYQRFLAKELTYVSFYKKHPHDTVGILRIASKGATPESIRIMIDTASEECIKKCKEFSSLVQ
jgi:DNA-directed RNA polymerase subunit L